MPESDARSSPTIGSRSSTTTSRSPRTISRSLGHRATSDRSRSEAPTPDQGYLILVRIRPRATDNPLVRNQMMDLAITVVMVLGAIVVAWGLDGD
jgi:hypothetical protein